MGTSIICRGIFSPRRFCRTKQEQRSSTCSQQRPLAALRQPAGTQAATAAVGNQHPPTPKAGVGHSFTGHPHRALALGNTWVTWVLLHVESAGRHLGRREGNPIADLLQQNNIRNDRAEDTGDWTKLVCVRRAAATSGYNPRGSPRETSS